MSDDSTQERTQALFLDFENLALGIKEARYKRFDIDLVLKRLLEKGKIIVKRAYADWERFSEYKRPLHEAAVELISIPKKHYSGKNSADIRLVVDTMDLANSKEHINTFVIASGDSDFTPLVSKLKENNKYVIGLGVKNSTADILTGNCDEFIFYDDLVRGEGQRKKKKIDIPAKKSEVFNLMLDAIQALQREDKEVLWGSMIKQTMKRKQPSFNQEYHGYTTFSQLLEDAQKAKLVKLKKDQKSGTLIVTECLV